MLKLSGLFDLKQHKEWETIHQVLITSKSLHPNLKIGSFTYHKISILSDGYLLLSEFTFWTSSIKEEVKQKIHVKLRTK